MKFDICTLDDFDVKGKVVLCRVDINQPIDKNTNTLKDITRIKGCIPTIRELSDKKARVVLLAHQGSDIEYKNYFTTVPHSAVISNLLGRKVQFIDDVTGPAARDRIRGLKDGEILLLDNVRFVAEEMTLFETKLKLNEEEQSKTQVVEKLAPLADLYVCDAFAAAHRSQPSLVGFEQVLPSAMGRLFEEEFCIIANVMENPARPCVFILGGAKIQDVFMMMSTVLEKGIADKVITGGLVSNIMLLAKGDDIGRQSADFIHNNNLSEFIKISGDVLNKYGDKILVPTDLAYVKNNARMEVQIKDLPSEGMLTDIGHDTVELYRKVIKDASTLFINGPMGIFENELTEYGTKSIWEAVAGSKAYSVLGGGDSITAVNKYGVEKDISYICTGGGALVRFVSGEELPVVKALRHAALKFGCNKSYSEKVGINMLSESMEKDLEIFAAQIRIETLKEFKYIGFGHVGGAMSIVETLAVLYGGLMNINPANPGWEDRDWLVMSKGHAGPALYSTLALKGYFPMDELKTTNKPGTNLPSHCDRIKTVGIDMTTGSLGQGMSTAIGVALGNRIDSRKNYTYLILGDGECDEGQVWEGALFAGHHKLDNLIAFVDNNKQQLDGYTKDICDLGDIAEKFREFKWYVQEADGGNVKEIYEALESAKKMKGLPSLIVLHTKKGKGCTFAEGVLLNHHMNFADMQIDEAIDSARKILDGLKA